MTRTPFALLITFAAASVPLVSPLDAQMQFKLDSLASKAKESVDISLPSSMLQLASGFLSKDKSVNPEIQKLIAGLKNITVKTFTFAEEGQYKPEDLLPIRDQLRAAGWGVLVGKHDDGGATDIYAKSEGGQIAGLAVVKAEPKEVKVVYIEGAIDLAGLAGLAGQFGIPPLGLPGQNSDPKKSKGNQ
jgi:hypothetical protein